MFLHKKINSRDSIYSIYTWRNVNLAINLEILYNLCTDKCENNTFEISDTFVAGCVTFCFDSRLVKCFQRVSSVIIPF